MGGHLQPSPEPIPDWDSVGYFKLILHREEVFGIRFPAHEIGSLTMPGRSRRPSAVWGFCHETGPIIGRGYGKIKWRW